MKISNKENTITEALEKMSNIEAPKNIKSMVSASEWDARVNLAALYRLIALHHWDDMIYTHISVRVPGTEDQFLINPWGMMFEEITASCLIKIDINGTPLSKTPYIVNPAGFTVHSALHKERPDAHCIIHLHTADGAAVSAQRHGLLPISQHSLVCHDRVAYHAYEGIALDLEERERLVKHMGNKPLMLLRNHGTLSIGIDCGTAFMGIYYLERACSIQIKALSSGVDLLNVVDSSIAEHTARQSQTVFNGIESKLAWPGLLRRLDRRDPSFRE